MDSGDLGGWLIGAVRSFHTAEYGRAVQGAVVGESSTTDEGCKAIVSHTSPQFTRDTKPKMVEQSFKDSEVAKPKRGFDKFWLGLPNF